MTTQHQAPAYTCHFTGVAVPASEVIWVGAIMPSVKARYPMANTPEAKAKRKQSATWFHESEANCNTCKHLARVEHEKCRAGFLYGKCTSNTGQPEASQYHGRRPGLLMFHPDDPGHMPCYESRWSAA